MFGYIKTHRPQLRVCEDETYKGIYCTLCKALGKRYGVLSRMLLSYDSAFLAIASMALTDEKVCFQRKRCPFNPTKKCHFCKNIPEEILFAADITVLLSYHKAQDNIADSTFFKALVYRILLILMLRMYKKAVKNRPDAAKLIVSYMANQAEVEKKKTRSIDEAAEPTAVLLGNIYSLYESNEQLRQKRYKIGYFLGRWIYMIDAFDDIDKDKKSGNYNPFVFGNDNFENVKGDILMTAGEAANALKELELKSFKGIVENVIIDGLYYQTLGVYERRLKNG